MGVVPGLILASTLLASPSIAPAVNPTVHIGQFAHTAWTSRDGYTLGAVFAMAQTRDGYLWLASENGLARFDGEKFSPFRRPGDKSFPTHAYSLLVSRDGTLWLGQYAGLASWNGTQLIDYPELKNHFVTSLLEDRDGTIWAGAIAQKGKLCEIRDGRARCHANEGAFGSMVWSLAEDNAGILWVGAETGLWRWKPGSPQRFELPGRVGDLIATTDELLVGIRGSGLKRLVGEKLEPYEIRSADKPTQRVPDNVVNSNKLMRDRAGGIWIGTDRAGLHHVEDGEAHSFNVASGLTGDIACSLFEDREGNIWFSSEKGLDRFRKLAVTTLWVGRGPASEISKSVLAAADGSMWVAAAEGITRWTDGSFRYFKNEPGLPAPGGHALFQDPRGRIWVTTYQGVAYFERGRFFAVTGQPGNDTISIAGDERNLWLSGAGDLVRFENDQIVERRNWNSLGSVYRASAIADRGGVWLGVWQDGGVLFYKDGEVRERYTPAQGLGTGHVAHLRLERDGTVWAATESGLSRIKDGRVRTLTGENGLPCNRIHWSIEDDSRTLWMNTSCGLVRITRDDLAAWISEPTRRVATKRWGAADGVPVRATPTGYSPPVAKARDGKLWFISGQGIQVVDPEHITFNTLPPPVYVEQVIADRRPHAATNGLRLPALSRDVTLEFTGLSLTDADSVQFRYRLEGHDFEWQEAGGRRQAFYTNLGPGNYRFFVTASNNNGVWNEAGTQLEFSIAPAYYQTLWFRIACALLLVGLVVAAVQLRVHRLRREEKRLRAVFGGIPAMAFSVNPDGSPDLVNQRWLDYTGLPRNGGKGDRRWESTIHPDDVESHLARWRASLANGDPFESEARHRSAAGEYRWFLVQALPLRDKQGKIVKWYGTLTDIEERKRAEEERERLRQMETRLAHTNRLSMLGELTASLAHEINQPIGAAIASAGAGLRWLDREEPALQQAREAFARIRDDGKRAADIITGLKAFYRKDVSPQRVLLGINEVVREMLVLLRREADQHSVVMRTELAPDLPAVRADRVQLQQVLMNLMVNGFEAMGNSGGELVIRTRPVADGLEVSVSDTGSGIPAGQMEQIFSAFVTTKAGGSGMGLAISRTIVEWHGGRLWAEANPGRGVTFRFTLPVAQAS
jgi:PAS domain S-box-containing protein